MHYEEQIIDGKLYYRTTPTGEWLLVDYTKLLDRLIEAENKLQELTERIENIEPLGHWYNNETD